MNLDNLYPHAGNHAIQSMVFALEWPAELTGASSLNVAQVRDAAKQALGTEFQQVEDQMAFTMSMPMASVSASSAMATGQPHLSGFALKRHSHVPGWPSRAITVSPENLLIQINDYTRWAAVRADVQRYLNVLMPLVGAHRPVVAVGQQVVDMFNWKADPQQLVLSEVFREGGKMLPPHIFELTDLWHSHHGYVTRHTEPTEFQQLDNVNVSRVMLNGVHTLQILCSHRAQYQQPQFIKTPTHVEQVLALHDRLHNDNKSVLSELLTDGVKAKLKNFSG